VREIYYLWQLAGGDVFAELRKHGLMITTPPVVSIPSLLVGEGQVWEFLHLLGALPVLILVHSVLRIWSHLDAAIYSLLEY
jgi:hypothetical protein